ncbi:Alpha/Beta hydrolase protein [Xylariales sp. PMI_506]|nr:Alpha/Beta hydrolase protein [Xylariales sp. PMI_506]
MATPDSKTIHQPIHPSMRDKLYPEYVALHDEVIQYVVPTERTSWDVAIRTTPSHIAFADHRLQEVASILDKDLGNFQIRLFTPHGEAPEGGWPALVWFHGGGWVLGGLGSENSFLRFVCKYVNIAVISINYRHAPEDIYPAAVEDVTAGYQWVVDPENAKSLGINTARLAIGGSSAGGNLAAVLSLKIASLNIQTKPLLQLLLCPVIDNTATTATAWASSQNAPWLTPGRMLWYREKYLPDPALGSNWDASPCLASQELLAQSPQTFIGVAGCDLLAPEALDFADKLAAVGVPVELQVYKGATHSILALAGIHKIARKLVYDASSAVAEALGTDFDPKTSPIEPST